MELTSSEKRMVKNYKKANCESFWARKFVAEDLRSWLLICLIFYVPMYAVGALLLEFFKLGRHISFLFALIFFSALVIKAEYQKGLIIKKLALKVEELEGKNT